ncbi:hypothetical protein C0992_003575 [Termitomyces sp. T32_za158]|nr:hypothetical protein C0992_003575 [Termitomyces sp. T32_za158]
MSSSSSSTSASDVQELADFIQNLSQNPDREAVASELEVLRSIYGENAVKLWHPSGIPRNRHSKSEQTDDTIRYEVELSLSSPHEDVTVRLLVSLPETYPLSSPPQLQLLSRYVGAFGADSGLFGSILRTFISVNGVEWAADSVCVFDGLQSVVERCTAWYENRLSMEKAGELLREDAKEQLHTDTPPIEADNHTSSENTAAVETSLNSLPEGLELFVAEPITDRKSVFIGRPVLHQDNDDDGETAAGGRLAHLLQILEVNNVLVIVTRYFGGIHLGPDRFKHINQAARNALEIGGFLEVAETIKKSGRGRKH